MRPNIVRRQFMRRVAEQVRGVVRALVTNGDNLTDAVLCEHPFERLARDIVAIGTANAGGENDLVVDRRNDAGRSDPQLWSGWGRDCSGRCGYGKRILRYSNDGLRHNRDDGDNGNRFNRRHAWRLYWRDGYGGNRRRGRRDDRW